MFQYLFYWKNSKLDLNCFSDILWIQLHFFCQASAYKNIKINNKHQSFFLLQVYNISRFSCMSGCSTSIGSYFRLCYSIIWKLLFTWKKKLKRNIFSATIERIVETLNTEFKGMVVKYSIQLIWFLFLKLEISKF